MASSKPECSKRYDLNNIIEAFAIITKILDTDDTLGLTQLSNRTHLSKNKTFRILSTLEHCGIVEKDLKSNYNIGISSIGIANRIISRTTDLDNVRPCMEQLAMVFNEAVYFADCTSGEAVLVDYADCCHPVKAVSFVGKAIQLPGSSSFATCSGNVARIGDISVDVGGIDLDITTVVMPFINDKGIRTGALVVLAPTFRMPPERIKTEIVPALRTVIQRQLLPLSDFSPDKFLSVECA